MRLSRATGAGVKLSTNNHEPLIRSALSPLTLSTAFITTRAWSVYANIMEAEGAVQFTASCTTDG